MASASWAWYKSMLTSRPLLTKATTSAVIMSLSDGLCQRFEIDMHQEIIRKHGANANLQAGCPAYVTAPASPSDKLLRYDWTRTSLMAVTGFTWSGPISHIWYQLLELMVKTKHVVWGMLFRLVLDAAIFSPIAVAGYFVWRTALEGKGVDAIVDKLQTKWKGAVQASWSFWPAANVVNFGMVPVPFRVLFNNSLSLLWNGYLSHVNSDRLESVVERRLQNPEDFVARGSSQRSQAEENALASPCVCSHCRPVKA